MHMHSSLTSSEINKKLAYVLPKNARLTDPLSLIAYGADAGCYRKTPRLVAMPSDEKEVRDVLQILHKNNIPVTFRAAGTSLSGQAITDSVLLQARGDKWQKVTILDGGERIRTQPGITGGRLNQMLKPYGRKFGPDPASVNSSMIGGIIANNASGMSCGLHANAYATIKEARIILNDGTLLDTGDKASREEFKGKKESLINAIIEIRDTIQNNPSLSDFIKDKYSIKNTTGYSMNAFVDFNDPIEIILHLMVGSEGTLGFISEALFTTVPVLPHRASGMIYFSSLADACNAVPALKEANATAIEVIDREALRSVQEKENIPPFIKDFGAGVTALLIDLEAASSAALDKTITDVSNTLSGLSLEREFEFTKDKKQILSYWNIRKGIFPSVGGMRKTGTSVIIEDIAIKMKYLTRAVTDIRNMLDSHGYNDAVIYGHALDGNLHFIFSQDFEDPGEVKKYEQMINSLVKLIVDKYQGSLKAEHGTGLNMAPFVRYEWGDEIYSLMQKVKKAFDPENILSPDVIITDDKELHLKNFKPLPQVDETVDKCIECGFCEINCLTTGFTLSPRQRIVVQRELQRMEKSAENPALYYKIDRRFKYQGDDTCATDGLCAISCPVEIDTGTYIKKLREKQKLKNSNAQKWAGRIADNFKFTQRFIKSGLQMSSFFRRALGSKIFPALVKSASTVSGDLIPKWHPFFPLPARFKGKVEHFSQNGKQKVIYFPSCINRNMGPSANQKQQDSLVDVTIEVLEKAGYQVILPENMENYCCGMPWESKGFSKIANAKSDALENALMDISDNGSIPVLCDMSPCLYRMRKAFKGNLKLFEPVEFAHDFLLEKLALKKIPQKIAIHHTCTSIKMGLHEKFATVANACANDVVVPEDVGCCGFAGDKGFSNPEMNDYALRKLKDQVQDCHGGYSNSRTCEIGLAKNSGIDYQSVMYLLRESAG